MLIQDYKLGFKLREFNSTKCYVARKGGENYFLKMIELDKDENEKIEKVEMEIECLKKLRPHKNIIELVDSFKIEKEDNKIIYCIVTEMMQMDLLRYLKKKRGMLSEKKLRVIMKKLLQAVLHLKKNNIVHHDIKPENIMIDEKKKRLKLIDFGMSSISQSSEQMKKMNLTVGTPYFMCPSKYKMIEYDGHKSDMWSCGVVLYNLLSGSYPFDTDSGYLSDLAKKVIDEDYLLPHCSPELASLLSGLLEKNPDNRLSAEEALQHSFFEDSSSTFLHLSENIFSIPSRNHVRSIAKSLELLKV